MHIHNFLTDEEFLDPIYIRNSVVNHFFEPKIKKKDLGLGHNVYSYYYCQLSKSIAIAAYVGGFSTGCLYYRKCGLEFYHFLSSAEGG